MSGHDQQHAQPAAAKPVKGTASLYARPELHHLSPLQLARLHYTPTLPAVLRPNAQNQQAKVVIKTGAASSGAAEDAARIRSLFPSTFGQPTIEIQAGSAFQPGTPLKVGVVLSGGQSPGGHNAISGLYDFLRARNPRSRLFGFLGGPIGIVNGDFLEITDDVLALYRNQGGFDVIGTGRDKIETKDQLLSSKLVCLKLELDGLVVIGGDDSNTNAAVLAEYFKSEGLKTSVVGLPKTIDGDLKNEHVEVSFGFDTATKVFSNLIGNIATDSLSAKKYYHFIRLMGRSASHITLECALQTHPNVALIGEEVAAKKQTLEQITNDICDVIGQRASINRDFGIVLVPEGLIEFVPEVSVLIRELNELLAHHIDHDVIRSKLSVQSRAVFDFLPKSIREELLLDRDPHGNVQVSRIETEKLLIHLVTNELKKRKASGSFKGKFAAIAHFFGYEGRCGLPSNFDATYCYALGRTAAALIEHGASGYMAVVQRLVGPAQDWRAGGMPLTTMMNIERRKGKDVPVIKKALVDLNGRAFQSFMAHRNRWATNDHYKNPGPVQYFGAVAEVLNVTLQLEHGEKVITRARV